MLAYLATHEDLPGKAPQYVVLNVQPAIPARAAKTVSRETVQGISQAEADAVLGPVGKFLDRHQASYSPNFKVGRRRRNPACREEVRSDLIVMGSRGHSAISTRCCSAH